MEHMATVQLLVAASGDHLLSADDTNAVAARQVLLGGVPEALVHVAGDTPVAQEVNHPVAEVAEGPVQVAQLRKNHLVKGTDRDK